MTTLPVIVHMPPMLYTDGHGQKWAVSGQFWVAVPETATLGSIDEYMIYKPRIREVVETEAKTWNVAGSKGKNYTVSFDGHIWRCNCVGFAFRRKCRHINEMMFEIA